jgi:hypothetical protein
MVIAQKSTKTIFTLPLDPERTFCANTLQCCVNDDCRLHIGEIPRSALQTKNRTKAIPAWSLLREGGRPGLTHIFRGNGHQVPKTGFSLKTIF